MSVDSLGNPLRFILTGGQQHDITQAKGLIDGYEGEYVLADKGYDSQGFRQYILERGMTPIPGASSGGMLHHTLASFISLLPSFGCGQMSTQPKGTNSNE